MVEEELHVGLYCNDDDDDDGVILKVEDKRSNEGTTPDSTDSVSKDTSTDLSRQNSKKI